jgi:tetratricopeptide (TPR) repeat protein
MAEIGAGEVDALQEEILVPPDFGDLPGGTLPGGGMGGDKPPTKGSPQAKRKFVMIGSGVLALVVVLGGYVWLNRDQWFPNSEAPGGQGGQPIQMPKSPVAEAQRLHSEGKTDQALKQLKLLPPDSAYYQEAQPLIAQWEAALNPQPTLEPEAAQQREQLLVESAQFFAAGEMLAAQEVLLAAGELAALEGEAAERMALVQQNLAPLQTEIAMVEEGEWELARPRLRVLYQNDPANRDVTYLLGVCHYNQGVQSLQRANLEQAAAHFTAVLDLEPEDREAQRHFRFAEAYQQRERDILFRTYVKYIPFR